MTKELVTGSRGFIGKHLTERLRLSGAELICVGHEELDDIVGVIEATKPTRIFNLATYGSHRVEKDVAETIKANLFRTYFLLEAANRTDYKAMVITGSSAEYGQKMKPMNENDSLAPETFYAASKAGATYLAQVWARQYDKPIVIARPFSIYGPQEAEYRFIPTVIRSCIKGEPMTLDPNGYHDWLYVDDMVDGLLMLSEIAEMVRGEVFNFGSGIQTSNQVVVESIEHILGKKANIVERKKMHKTDSTMWVADNRKAKAIGWNPKISLARGLSQTVDYYAKLYA